MRYIHFVLAAFLILFAMVDIALSGACCNEDVVDTGQDDATCYCCCSHVTIERTVQLAGDFADQPIAGWYRPFGTFSFQSNIYHPPRSF